MHPGPRDVNPQPLIFHHGAGLLWGAVILTLFLGASLALLPGYHTADSGLFWLTFWATLLAGLILGVPVFIAVSRRLDALQRQAEAAAQARETKRNCEALREDVKLFLSQSNNFSLREPEKTVPEYMHRMERLLEDKPLSNWAAHAGPGDQQFLCLINAFRQCYAYFLAACDEVHIDLPDALRAWELEHPISEAHVELARQRLSVLPWQSLMFWVTSNRVGNRDHYFKRSGQPRVNALRLNEVQVAALEASLDGLIKHPRAEPVLAYFLKKRFDLIAEVQALVDKLNVKADPDHADVPPSDQATGIVYGVIRMVGGGAVGTASGIVTVGEAVGRAGAMGHAAGTVSTPSPCE